MSRGGGHHYRAHGLVVQSDAPIPELRAVPASEPDIRVSRDPAAADALRRAGEAAGLDPLSRVVLPAAAEDSGGVFGVPAIGAFWVRGGREIRVAPEPGADRGLVDLFILGSALGLALFQRGAFLLHGAGVATPAGAALFLGPSGAGKSTIAARLGQAGFAILGDDTAALWPEGEGFALRPSGTSFKLWRDSLEAAGLGDAAGAQVGDRVEKFYLANPRLAEDRPHPIREILVLGEGAPGSAPRVEPLSRLEAVDAVLSNTYRPQFAEAFGRREAEFAAAVRLAATVPVARLLRPWDHGATAEVVEVLRTRWDGERTGGTMRAGIR